MKIKVNYDLETNLVLGYYPESINYSSIPEPFIEIEFSEQVFNKTMCVVEGVYQEFETPLNTLKIEKKNQLRLNRDAANLRPIVSIQADEVLHADGVDSRTSTKKYFVFSVADTGQPATAPSSIIFSTILASLANPTYYLRYSCFIIEGESTRKGYVAIDMQVASTILGHMSRRATTNIAHANELEALITAANSKEELDEININFE